VKIVRKYNFTLPVNQPLPLLFFNLVFAEKVSEKIDEEHMHDEDCDHEEKAEEHVHDHDCEHEEEVEEQQKDQVKFIIELVSFEWI
ncbi:MAG: hypothetical protein R6U11_12245, partial [Bacteroidales bacterium]